MKLYDCKVRLAGSMLNEVRESKVTPAEIELLRAIHGADAILDIQPSDPANVKRASTAERARLAEKYAGSNAMTAEAQKKRLDLMRELFGHDRSPLPEELADPVADEDASEGDDIIEVAEIAPPKAPIKRTKLAEPAFAD